MRTKKLVPVCTQVHSRQDLRPGKHSENAGTHFVRQWEGGPEGRASGGSKTNSGASARVQEGSGLWVGEPEAVAPRWDQVPALWQLPIQHRAQETNKDVQCRVGMALSWQTA